MQTTKLTELENEKAELRARIELARLRAELDQVQGPPPPAKAPPEPTAPKAKDTKLTDDQRLAIMAAVRDSGMSVDEAMLMAEKQEAEVRDADTDVRHQCYAAAFSEAGGTGGWLPAAAAVKVLGRSKLPQKSLAAIWTAAKQGPPKDKMSLTEFENAVSLLENPLGSILKLLVLPLP